MFLQVSSPFLLIRPSPLSIVAVFLRPPCPLFFSPPPPHPSSFSLFPLPSQGIIEKMANTLQGEIAVLEHSEWIAKVLYKMTGFNCVFQSNPFAVFLEHSEWIAKVTNCAFQVLGGVHTQQDSLSISALIQLCVPLYY
jgi:hypothetical protein